MTFLKTTVPVLRVSGPSRGMGGFLLYPENKEEVLNEFPAPLEAWVVSYPYLVSPKGFNTQDSSYLETILSIPYFTRAFS